MNIRVIRSTNIQIAGRKAYTLIEILLVLAIATALVSSALNIFSITKEQSKFTHTVNDVTQLQSIILSIYQFQGGYSDIAPSALQTSLSPYAFINGKIINVYGGIIAINPDTIYFANDSYDIIVTNLNSWACANLAATKFGDSLYAVNINPGNGTPVIAGGNVTLPISQANALLLCTGSLNSVGFQFH